MGGGFGPQKDSGRNSERERNLEEREEQGEEEEEEERTDFSLNVKGFFFHSFSPQTDAKADGGELAENGRKKE